SAGPRNAVAWPVTVEHARRIALTAALEIGFDAGDPAAHLPVGADLRTTDDAGRCHLEEIVLAARVASSEHIARGIPVDAVADVAAGVVAGPLVRGPRRGRRGTRRRIGRRVAKTIVQAGADDVIAQCCRDGDR